MRASPESAIPLAMRDATWGLRDSGNILVGTINARSRRSRRVHRPLRRGADDAVLSAPGTQGLSNALGEGPVACHVPAVLARGPALDRLWRPSRIARHHPRQPGDPVARQRNPVVQAAVRLDLVCPRSPFGDPLALERLPSDALLRLRTDLFH